MAKKLAMVFGVVFVIVGLLGFISNPIVGAGDAYFRTDMIHNVIHLVVGVAMLAMAGSMAVLSLNLFGAIYLLLALIGFVQGGDKLLGFLTYNVADNWLHLVLGVVLLVAGMTNKGSSNTMPTYTPPSSSGMGGMNS